MNEEEKELEDNLPLVNYIMLHRIYDMLTLIANIISKEDNDRLQISKMVEYHKEGFLLGPAPAYKNSGENNG
ncbi:MAG: hypothetical protein EBS19_05830 [Spirochaetia bacterium]|jgi:hypothetical protein|nr:hypothetical protein [Spirochaetia bacterium]